LLGVELVAAGTDQGPPVRAEVLLALIIALIEQTHSGDALFLAMTRACALAGATEAEMQYLEAAIRSVRAGVSMPKGMFDDF